MNKCPFIRDQMDKQESLSRGTRGGLFTDQRPFLVFVSITFLSQMKILDFFCFHFWLVPSFLMVSYLLPSTGFPCARQQYRVSPVVLARVVSCCPRGGEEWTAFLVTSCLRVWGCLVQVSLVWLWWSFVVAGFSTMECELQGKAVGPAAFSLYGTASWYNNNCIQIHSAVWHTSRMFAVNMRLN